MSPMSTEDRAFLEAVMKEGIIDENERMKSILKDVTGMMEKWRQEPATDEEGDHAEDLLQELRDIVEQIDYARAFCSMKGLPFLLGCVAERDHMPVATRAMCLGIIATLCANNPPVQKELLELGAIGALSRLFFLESESASNTDHHGQMRAKIIQAIGSNVRSHELAETVFCELPQAPTLIEKGLGLTHSESPPPFAVRQRTLFFFRALITSDSSTRIRVQKFGPLIAQVAQLLLDDQIEGSQELREMALSMVEQILDQQKSVDCIVQHKNSLVALGVRRIAAMRALDGEEKVFAAMELESWERLLVLLARAIPDGPEAAAEPVSLLQDGKTHGSSGALAQS
jgi:hsp70-interacting protein